jgi:hypothetical protein
MIFEGRKRTRIHKTQPCINDSSKIQAVILIETLSLPTVFPLSRSSRVSASTHDKRRLSAAAAHELKICLWNNFLLERLMDQRFHWHFAYHQVDIALKNARDVAIDLSQSGSAITSMQCDNQMNMMLMNL